MSAIKGCPKGGVLSPLLWSLVIDDLIVKLSDAGFYVLGYAFDLVVLIRGKHENVIFSLAQIALNIITKLCSQKVLSVNPQSPRREGAGARAPPLPT